jgi:hypothetical protein
MYSQHDLAPSSWGNIAVRGRPHYVALRTVTDREKVSYARGVTGKIQKHLFVEQTKGYVKALEKSTALPSTMKEVFEHGAQND